MTRHKHAHTGLVTPSPLDRWINAMLRMLAMLVLNVASTLQMIRRRGPVIGTQPTPTDLPKAKTDTQSKETLAFPQDRPAAQYSSRISAHAEQARIASRPSKHERVLATLSSSFLQKREPRSHTHSARNPRLPARRSASLGMTSFKIVGCIENAPLEADLQSAFAAKAGIQTLQRLLKQLATNKNAAA